MAEHDIRLCASSRDRPDWKAAWSSEISIRKREGRGNGLHVGDQAATSMSSVLNAVETGHVGHSPSTHYSPHPCAHRLQHSMIPLRQASSVNPLEGKSAKTNTVKPSCAISDAQLRAGVNVTIGSRPTEDYARRAITKGDGAPLSVSASKDRAPARNSADDVTAAYTLLQQHAAAREHASPRHLEARRCAPAALSASQAAVVALAITAENEQTEGRSASGDGHHENHYAVPSNWSVTNVGFNEIKSEARARTEQENRDGYVRAAFASQDADKSYLAEAAYFRFRYPHTLGRIEALSRVRSDRINAGRDRVRAVTNRKHKKTEATSL